MIVLCFHQQKKTMKHLIVLIILNLSLFDIFAQNMQEVIYLKDGSIIRGKLISNESDVVKIESCCGNVYVFKQSDILRIVREESDYNNETKNEKQTKTSYRRSDTLKTKGYFNFTSFGTLVGSKSTDKPTPLSIIMEHNYRFNSYVAIGAITGVEMLNEAVLPIGVNVKGMLPLRRGNTIYLGLSGGYSISLDNPVMDYYEVKEANGGFMFNTELGVIFPSSTDISCFIAIGYRYNELNYVREDWWMTEVERTMYFNRLSLRFGMVFH
jgi:hypothetical protein